MAQTTQPRITQMLRRRWPDARPWLALAALFVLFSLPDGVRDAGLRLRQVRPSGDLLALLTVGAIALSFGPRWKPVRSAALVYGIVLYVFSLDRMLIGFLMQEEPLLYDQAFMARHLVVLVGDLWSLQTAATVVGFVVVVAALGWAASRLLRVARALLEPAQLHRTQRVFLVVWLVALPLSITDSVLATKIALVTWLSPKLADNLETSLRTYKSVERGLSDSPYGGYMNLSLTRKPDVDIYVVESYGRLLWDHVGMRRKHMPLLASLEERFTAAGWHSVSAFSRSPVRGARSWLADASMIVGAPISYEAIFHHTLSELSKRPTLVKFFRQQGYETLFVSPSSRRRPGVPNKEHFSYDRFVELDTIRYVGPAIGWGVVPDQYSISYVEEHMVRGATRPRFMNFHLVSSHAPWTEVPARVADYRVLNSAAGKRLVDPAHSVAQTLRRLGHYDRENRDVVYRPLKTRYVDGYVATIGYDLDLLADTLAASTSKDRLVILIGDHQPPLVAAKDASYDAPIHVLARDKSLLDEFRSRGFTNGLRIPNNRASVMGHAGMFSLLARVLTRCCSAGSRQPEFLPYGRELLKEDKEGGPR